MIRGKKGQAVGLGTVGSVLIGFLILGLTAIAVFAAFSNLKTSNIISNITAENSFVNETITLNSTGGIPATAQGKSGVILSSVFVYNTSTGDLVLEAGNYSISGGTFTNLTGSIYFDSTINVTASLTYSNGSSVPERGFLVSTSDNITGATTSFFANANTLLTILFVVILMGFLGLMIFVVRRFGGSGGSL